MCVILDSFINLEYKIIIFIINNNCNVFFNLLKSIIFISTIESHFDQTTLLVADFGLQAERSAGVARSFNKRGCLGERPLPNLTLTPQETALLG
jgi:hypothetical protein